jgi:hypothetical protein
MCSCNSPEFESIRNADILGPYLSNFMPMIEYNLSIRVGTNRGQIPESTYAGNTQQFGKGYDRLKTWLLLSNESLFWNPKTNRNTKIEGLSRLTKLQKTLCLAAFIIYFQVFGDGNHRTAYEYFRTKMSRDISEEEINIIKGFRSSKYLATDYQALISIDDNVPNPAIAKHLQSIIGILSSKVLSSEEDASDSAGGGPILISKMGGKKHKKRHSSRKKTKRKRKIKSRKYKYRKSGRR